MTKYKRGRYSASIYSGYGKIMKTLTVAEAQADFYKLLDEVNLSHKPVRITSNVGDAVLISDKVWKDINKVIHSSSASD